MFLPNAQKFAASVMSEAGHPEFSEKFSMVIRFLQINPSSASGLRGRSSFLVGSEEYIRAAASQFAYARTPKLPAEPSTIPDKMVSFILQHYFNCPELDLERIKKEHSLSMAAENIVGDLLERYLADGLEPTGWVWISGALVKGADFLHPPRTKKDKWYVLQVKNRDNSENSSSSAIRVGTEIKKWFRTFSKKPETNWNNFPDITQKGLFSEEGFANFVRDYLLALKA